MSPIVLELVSIMILQHISLSFCANFDSSSNFECILIVGGIGTLSCIIFTCTTCFCIAVLIIKLTRKVMEEDCISEDEDNSVYTNTQLIEPTLNYDDVVNMDSLPPYIPGYTYNANIANTDNFAILSTGGGDATLTRVTPTINTQESICGTEIYVNLPSPPPYLTIN